MSEEYKNVKTVDAKIRKNLTYLVLQTTSISEDTKKETGIYESRFTLQLPIGCTDYLIKLGYKTSSDEGITYVYFKEK